MAAEWGNMNTSNNRAAFSTDQLNVGPLALPWLSASENSESGMCCGELALGVDGTVHLTFTYDFGRHVLAASQEQVAALFGAVKAGEAEALVGSEMELAGVELAGFRFVTDHQKVRVSLVSDPSQCAYADWDELSKLLVKIAAGRFDAYVTTQVASAAVA
jgi:hypothetical protein